MKNEPETCQRQKAWEETKKKFQEDMKKLLAEQVRKEKTLGNRLIRTQIELVLDAFTLFATRKGFDKGLIVYRPLSQS